LADLFQYAKQRDKQQARAGKAERLRKAEIEAQMGMRRAEDHADKLEPAWSEGAYEFLIAFAIRNSEFISEDVSDAHIAAGLPQPPTLKAWGNTYKRAQKRGIIKRCGTGKSMRRHGSDCPKWRSLVFEGGAA
jgi:hypothetical protein